MDRHMCLGRYSYPHSHMQQDVYGYVPGLPMGWCSVKVRSYCTVAEYPIQAIGLSGPSRGPVVEEPSSQQLFLHCASPLPPGSWGSLQQLRCNPGSIVWFVPQV